MSRRNPGSTAEADYYAELREQERQVPHWTYVVRDASGLVLYVGCTKNPLARMRTHQAKARASWWPLRASVDWQRHGDYYAGRIAETHLIRTLAPEHNKQLRPLRVAS